MTKGSSLLAEVSQYVPKDGEGCLWWLGQLGYILRLGDASSISMPTSPLTR